MFYHIKMPMSNTEIKPKTIKRKSSNKLDQKTNNTKPYNYFTNINLTYLFKVIRYYLSKGIDFVKSNIYDISRYSFTAFMVYILYKIISPFNFEFRTLGLLIFIEILAISLSSFSLFTFTKFNFIKGLENERNKQNKSALYILIGFIFLSVHLCIGLSILGLYITQISN